MNLEPIREKLAQIWRHEKSDANWSKISYRMKEPIEPVVLEQFEEEHGNTNLQRIK